MKIKKRLILTILASIYSNALLAEVKIGVGTRVSTFIDVASNNFVTSANYISIPVKFSNKFIIDTELIYLNSNSKEGGDNRRTKIKGGKIGVFYYGNSISRVKPYFGVKFGMAKNENHWKFGFSNVLVDTSETVKTIGPVIGAEIEVLENFAIVGEIGLIYSKSQNTEFTGTDSRLVARFYFL